MNREKTKSGNNLLPRPRITFSQIGQISFTIKEVLKIAFSVKPRLIITILVINSFLGVSTVISFYLEKLLLDRLISAVGAKNIQVVLTPLAVIVSLSLLLSLTRNVLSSFNDFLRRNLSRYFDIETDVMIGSKVSSLDIATLEDPDFRDKLNKIERESSRRAWQLMMPISEMPNYIFGIITAAGVVFLISPIILLVVILLSLPRIAVNRRFIKIRYKLHSDLAPQHRIWGWLRYYLIQNRNFLELKILKISDHLVSRLKKVGFYAIDTMYNLGKKEITSRSWTFIPINIFEFIVAMILVYWVIIVKITVGTFQLYLRSLRSIEDNIASLTASLLGIYENYIYVSDLVWLMNLKPKVVTQKSALVAQKPVKIKFDKVWFKYRKDNPYVLKDISFDIKPGEKIALVGENGAGKSTLIKLLGRFYDPNKGDVYLSDTNLKEIKLEDWRNRIAVLFQQFETYPFSVYESVGFGQIKDINNLDKIKKVIKKVGIDKYIESLPLGYNNPLTPELDKGVMPSIGQLQRVGIARILFRDSADILILDEPTSNIDPEAEEKIFKELVNITKDKILIFVTQRFSTVRIADRIFVIDKGRIIEHGTHKQLMEKDGKYARLFNLQAQAYVSS